MCNQYIFYCEILLITQIKISAYVDFKRFYSFFTTIIKVLRLVALNFQITKIIIPIFVVRYTADIILLNKVPKIDNTSIFRIFSKGD